MARYETESGYINSSDPDHQYLAELANDIVSELLTEDWVGLKKDGTFTILDGVTVYELPNDFDHFARDSINTDSVYNQVTFPVTNMEWRFLEANNYGISYYGRVTSDVDQNIVVEFDESVPVGTEIKYIYWSKFPIKSSGGAYQKEFLSDQDIWLLDDRLLIKLVHANWIESLGLEGWEKAASKAALYKNKIKNNQVVGRTMCAYGDQALPPNVLGE